MGLIKCSSCVNGKWLNLPAPLDIQWPKCFQLQGALPPWPPDQGFCPWTPLGALPPDPRYTLVLRTRHGAPQPLTPSVAYGSRSFLNVEKRKSLTIIFKKRFYIYGWNIFFQISRPDNYWMNLITAETEPVVIIFDSSSGVRRIAGELPRARHINRLREPQHAHISKCGQYHVDNRGTRL